MHVVLLPQAGSRGEGSGGERSVQPEAFEHVRAPLLGHQSVAQEALCPVTALRHTHAGTLSDVG